MKLLLQVTARAVREVLEDLYPDVPIGMVYTVHTFGRDLVITKGGLRKNTWVEIDEIPGNRLASEWRYLLCKTLRRAHPNEPDLQHAITQGYHDHRGCQVYTESFYPKGLQAAKYIGRYLGHPPLAG
ncbi:MAG: transposase [Anaerolineales bacterium]